MSARDPRWDVLRRFGEATAYLTHNGGKHGGSDAGQKSGRSLSLVSATKSNTLPLWRGGKRAGTTIVDMSPRSALMIMVPPYKAGLECRQRADGGAELSLNGSASYLPTSLLKRVLLRDQWGLKVNNVSDTAQYRY